MDKEKILSKVKRGCACDICKEPITEADIEQFNFEYSQTKRREIFMHTTCYRKTYSGLKLV